MFRPGLCLLLVSCAALAQTLEKGTQPGQLDGGPLESAFGNCRQCHDKGSTFEETLYMPFDGWVSSMMGNSARDPLFRAALAVANQDKPGVGVWCLRCHSPQAFVRGHTVPPDAGAFDAFDMEGVTCDVCHRSLVPAGDPAAPYLNNAQLFFTGTDDKFGPHDDAFSSGHAPVKSAFTGSSEMCGQCHQVHSIGQPWRANDGGIIQSRFPIDTTYMEWKQSDFARKPFDAGFASCADCHLPRFTGPDGGTTYKTGKFGKDRENPRQHFFVGGNVFGLKAVQASNPSLLPEYAEQFALTEFHTRQTLKRSAGLSISGPASVDGGVAVVKVKVKNLTGHKLPTGYADGRRVVVQVLVDGEVVSGRFDGGTLLSDSQLRVYEAHLGQQGKGTTEHLALQDSVVLDSRIPATGMIGSIETRPTGVDWFNETDGGLRDFDEVAFNVPIRADAGTGDKVKVTARLFHQSTTPEYVQFLAAENRSDDAGKILLDAYNAVGGAVPTEMASADFEFTVVRAAPIIDAGPGGGAGGGTGGAGGTGGGTSEVPKGCGCSTGDAGLLALSVLASGLLRRRSRSP